MFDSKHSAFQALVKSYSAELYRYGYWLALHIILLCASGYTPTQIAAVLFCSRSSVYRAVRAYRAGSLADLTDCEQPRRVGSLTPSLRRSLLALLKRAPSAYG